MAAASGRSKPSGSRYSPVPDPPRRNDYQQYLQQSYPDIEFPADISLATFTQDNHCGTRYTVLESSAIDANEPLLADIAEVPNGHDPGRRQQPPNRRKKEPTEEDKVYRSDREFVKRRSHQRMIWYFRKLNIRHPAAIRMHLEKVKHADFEIPNLQCVFPHPEHAIAFDDEGTGPRTKNSEAGTTNLTYYNLYCATAPLVERVRSMMRTPKDDDPDYNKRVITFIADIVGRLLWHGKRTHAVMFAKADHYDRDCFLLYSRQSEPTPFMMRSDSFFCRRHESDRFKSFAPQPDLTRANSTRVSNESAIYVVGCNVSELWDTFPYDYRITGCRPMKSLCERIRRLDPAVLDHVFSPIVWHLNGDRDRSPYVEVAASTRFDLISVLLRDTDLKDATTDDDTAYRDYLERFVTLAVTNVHAMLKNHYEFESHGRYRDTSVRLPSPKRLDQIVLHNVRYRYETRALRTNRVYYYRNDRDMVCCRSLLDDHFEDRVVRDEDEVAKRRPVYFYDLVSPSECATESGDADVNLYVLRCWVDATTMLEESAHTIGQYLTPEVMEAPLPDDPFYPKSDMSVTDLAIDRMLEKAIKHAKKYKLPSSGNERRRSRRRKAATGTDARGGKSSRPDRKHVPPTTEEDEKVLRSLSRAGENRLRDGYSSPTNFEMTVVHEGAEIPVTISAAAVPGATRPMTRVDYDYHPHTQVEEKLIGAYLIDPTDPIQVRLIPGQDLIDRSLPSYVPLRYSDRIVRVFCIKAAGSGYIFKPYVFVIFRNMPYAEIDDQAISDRIYAAATEYSNLDGFGVFDEFEHFSPVSAPHRSLHPGTGSVAEDPRSVGNEMHTLAMLMKEIAEFDT